MRTSEPMYCFRDKECESKRSVFGSVMRDQKFGCSYEAKVNEHFLMLSEVPGVSNRRTVKGVPCLLSDWLIGHEDPNLRSLVTLPITLLLLLFT